MDKHTLTPSQIALQKLRQIRADGLGAAMPRHAVLLTRRLSAVMLTLSLAGCTTSGAFTTAPFRTLTSEDRLRALALEVSQPVCPAGASSSDLGLTVVNVHVGTSGRVLLVEPIESPSDAVAASITSTVERWTFRPPLANGRPVLPQAKLTFYTVVRDGRCQVIDPEPHDQQSSTGSSASANSFQ